MSKLKVIIIVLFTSIVAGAVIAALFMQQREVSITTTTPVVIYSSERSIDTIDTAKTLRLKDGEYCSVPISDTYSKDKECFMVYKENKEISIKPSLSKLELASKLEGEFDAIRNVISSRYSSIINQYTFCKGELLIDGSWYGGILRDKVASVSDGGNYYYFVMHKEGSEWNSIVIPSVALSKHTKDTESVPANVLEYVNTMSPCDAEVSDQASLPPSTVDEFTSNEEVLNY